MPDYRQSMFYAPVLKSLEPKWSARKDIADWGMLVSILGAFAGLFVALWVATILLVVACLFFIFYRTAKRHLARHIPTALVITERLSKEWFDRNIYDPQQKRELEIEISRLGAIERDKAHPSREVIKPGGGTMYGAGGEDLG